MRRLQLYRWQWAFEAGGVEALGGAGRSVAERALPSAETLALARERIAALERRLGQQQLELDFFRQALRHIEGLRQPGEAAGTAVSTPSSKR